MSEFLLHVYYMNVFVLVYGQYHGAQKIFERYLAMDIESINVELMYQFCFSIILIRFNYIERVIFRETKKYSRLLNLHDLLYIVPYLSFSVSCSAIKKKLIVQHTGKGKYDIEIVSLHIKQLHPVKYCKFRQSQNK